jgi:hypothetical protein
MVALDTRRIGWRSPNRDGSSGFELERNGHFWPMAEIAFLAFDFRSSAGSGRSSHSDSAAPDLTLATHSRSVRGLQKPDRPMVGGESLEMFRGNNSAWTTATRSRRSSSSSTRTGNRCRGARAGSARSRRATSPRRGRARRPTAILCPPDRGAACSSAAQDPRRRAASSRSDLPCGRS